MGVGELSARVKSPVIADIIWGSAGGCTKFLARVLWLSTGHTEIWSGVPLNIPPLFEDPVKVPVFATGKFAVNP